jgi:hypothetical protein
LFKNQSKNKYISKINIMPPLNTIQLAGEAQIPWRNLPPGFNSKDKENTTKHVHPPMMPYDTCSRRLFTHLPCELQST